MTVKKSWINRLFILCLKIWRDALGLFLIESWTKIFLHLAPFLMYTDDSN